MNRNIKRIGAVGWLLVIFMLCPVTVRADYHYGVKTVAKGETLTDSDFILYSSGNKTVITNDGTVNVNNFTVYGNGEKTFTNNGIFNFTGSDSFATFGLNGNSSFVNNGTATFSGCYNFMVEGEFINEGTLFLSNVENANLPGMKNNGVIVYENVIPSLIRTLEDQIRDTGNGRVMSREEYENSQQHPAEYQITYDLNGGSWKNGNGPDEAACSYTTEKEYYMIGVDSPYDKINENIVRANYTFAGWICEEQGRTEPALQLTVVSDWRSNITLKAVWVPKPQYVFYHLAGGSFSEDIESPKIETDPEGNIYTPFNVESEAFTLPEPSKKGYVFKGWGLGGTDQVFSEVTIEKGTVGNVAYTAQWEAQGNIPYTVNVYYMDGEGKYGNSPNLTYAEQGETDGTAEVSASAYVKKGFTFDSDRSVSTGTITGDGQLTLTLYYKRDRHTITFKNYEGNEIIREYTGYYGTALQYPADPEYSLDDYICTFKGWAEKPESDRGIVLPGEIERDRTFYAAFEKEPTFCIITLKKLTGFEEPDEKMTKLDKGGDFSIQLSLADDMYYIGTKEWGYAFKELAAVYSDEPGGLQPETDYHYTVSEDGRSVTITIPKVTRNLDITACAQYHEEHSYSDEYDTVLKDASCTEGGRVRHFCYKCGQTQEEDTERDMLNHTELVKTEAKPPTYLEEGNTEYYYCTGCKKYFSDEEGSVEITREDTVIKKLEEQPLPKAPEKDTEADAMRLNRKARALISGEKLKVTWGKVSEAAGYEVYAGKCGGRLQLVKDVRGSDTTSLTVSRISGKKISSKGTYKVQVRAYLITDGKKEIAAKSQLFHFVGKNKKGYTNAKSIRVSRTKVTVKKGKSWKAKAKTIKQNRKKKLLPKKHVAAYRYFSTNKKIASVSKSGKIKGINKGTCTVYVMAANGVKKGIKVTVK